MIRNVVLVAAAVVGCLVVGAAASLIGLLLW